MDKKLLWIIAGILVVIGVAGAYVYATSRTQPEPTQQATQHLDEEKNEAPANEKPTESAVGGRYTDYSKQGLAQAKGDKILFFHAPWCPQCREAEASIKATNLPDNLTIFKVDYDSSQELRQKYDVTLQTTFVKVDDNGDKIDSFVAYDEPSFAAVQKELLQ